MSKLVKEIIAKDLASRYHDARNAVWVEIVGLDGITTNRFRRELRKSSLRLEVVRRSLLQRAVGDGPLSRLARELRGPAALVTGGDTAIEIAKILEKWVPQLPPDTFRMRGALLDGEYVDESRVAGLSKMPTKADLQARLVAIVLAPGSNVVGAALGPGRQVAGVIKALIEKLEKGEPVASAN